MNKTRLINAMRQKVCDRLLDATFREREKRLEQRQAALALRVLRRELGEDVLIRIAALPPGWLPMIKELRFENHDFCYMRRNPERSYMEHRQSLVLAQSIPVPSFVSHNQLEIGQASKDEIDAFVADAIGMWKERELLRTQVVGTLGGFYTVEEFAEKWPEGYAHFPHPELVPTTLPAYRVEDLNARLLAAREAA